MLATNARCVRRGRAVLPSERRGFEVQHIERVRVAAVVPAAKDVEHVLPHARRVRKGLPREGHLTSGPVAHALPQRAVQALEDVGRAGRRVRQHARQPRAADRE